MESGECVACLSRKLFLFGNVLSSVHAPPCQCSLF